MTQLQTKVLQHLIDVATGTKWNIPPQKTTAWESAKRFAEIDPFQLADLPQLLTAEMKRLQGLSACESSTGKTATLQGQVTSRLESGR